MENFSITNTIHSAIHSVGNKIKSVGKLLSRPVTYLYKTFSSLTQRIHNLFVSKHPRSNKAVTPDLSSKNIAPFKLDTEETPVAHDEQTPVAQEEEAPVAHDEPTAVAQEEEAPVAQVKETPVETVVTPGAARLQGTSSEMALIPANVAPRATRLEETPPETVNQPKPMTTAKKLSYVGVGVLGVAGLATGAYYGYQHSDLLQDKFLSGTSAGLEWAKGAADQAKSFIGSRLSQNLEFFNDVSSKVGQGFKTIFETATSSASVDKADMCPAPWNKPTFLKWLRLR